MSTHPGDPASRQTLDRWHREGTYLTRVWTALGKMIPPESDP